MSYKPKINKNKVLFGGLVVCLATVLFFGLKFVVASSPSGNDWFEIITDHQTGADNTGDGGTGNPQDFNYYYVGQNFTGNIKINSSTGTNAANIWVDYDTAKLSASNVQAGTFFPNWSGQPVSGGRIKSTGYRTSGYSIGLGNFGNVEFTAREPTEASYGIGFPTRIDINTGTIGGTTESNISRDGVDVLDDAEDFRIHIWADTKKPYAEMPSPADGALSTAVEDDYLFSLRDTKNGEGDDNGVGTGVNTSTGLININDGSGNVSYNAHTFFGCSGIWGTNLCNTTINPPSPSSISGDLRNWEYDTTYTVNTSGFRDLASSTQDQLGDSNGPNTMDTKVWTFTTEPDIIRPRIFNEAPSRGSSTNAVDSNIVFDVLDKKIYPSSISGSGINTSTCKINLSSISFPLTTFQQGDPEVIVTNIDYGARFSINPGTDFGQNETVSVSVYDCLDGAGNSMVTENYSFSTVDSDAPYVDGVVPANDGGISRDGNITFHIKDSGTGIDLDNTVVYLNGIYYSKNGGAGSVTSTGTKIEFSSSLSFMGGNYFGDTTGVTGTFGDYEFIINSENDFVSGEAVPIAVYSRDVSSNLMESFSYAVIVDGGGSCNGQTYCGPNTSWDGAVCVGQASSSGGTFCPLVPSGSVYCGENTTWDSYKCNGKLTSGSEYCGENTEWNGTRCVSKQKEMIYNETVTQVSESSILVTWYSAEKGDTQLRYNGKSLSLSQIEFYAYNSQKPGETEYYHSVLVDKLETGKVYYFRPVSKIKGKDYPGVELTMAPKFITEIKEVTKETIKEIIVEGGAPGVCLVTPEVQRPTTDQAKPQIPSAFSIKKTTISGNNIIFQGTTKPFTRVKINIINENE